MSTSLKKVYGPPGSGKTTWLLNYIKKSGVPYERVAFVSFARATIYTTTKRLGLNDEQTKYFKTIHGMNYMMLGIKKNQIANSRLHEFPAKFSPQFIETNMKTEVTERPVAATDEIDDNFYYQMLKDRDEMLPDDYVPPHLVKHAGLYINFKKRYRQWMEDNDLIDFTGLLERGIAEEKVPPVDLLCVDEWQDLTPLQVHQVNFWAQNIPHSVHAGDDDQTIHAWAGARHEDFLEFPKFEPQEKKIIVLNKTHRLPTQILAMSIEYIRNNKKRVDKNVTPTKNTKGLIEYTHLDRAVDVAREQLKTGTVMVLARNHSLIPKLVKDFNERGVPTNNTLRPTVKAIGLIHSIGEYVTLQQLYDIAESKAIPKRGLFKPNAKEGLRSLGEAMATAGEETIQLEKLVEYGVLPRFIEAIHEKDITILKGKNLESALRIYEQYGPDFRAVDVKTIHRSKGDEADTVIVCLDVGKKTYEASRQPDIIEEERRVWYVAMTRAKSNLIFLQPTYSYYYPALIKNYVKLYLQNEQSN